MAKQKFTGFQSGMSFRRLKKVLKRRELETADFKDKVKCVACCHVEIEFDREIAYFDDAGYHYNVQFDEWWSNFSEKVEQNHDRYGYLHVAYSNPKTLEIEEGRRFYSNLVRWLIVGDRAFSLQPRMSFYVYMDPVPFPTSPGYLLYGLKNAMEDCAKYCGGTVRFSYSDMHRVPVTDDIYKTLILGKD